MRIATWRAPRRTRSGRSSIHDWITDAVDTQTFILSKEKHSAEHELLGPRSRHGGFCAPADRRSWGYGTRGPGSAPAAKSVVDSNGNMHVPENYRLDYEYLGSWAVAADQGSGSKELHIVFASPGAAEAYRAGGAFPQGTVLVKEVFQATTRVYDHRNGEPPANLEGVVRHGPGHHRAACWKQALGRRLGMVLVRCRESDEDYVDRLQDGLSRLSRASASYRMDLRGRVSVFAARGVRRCPMTCHQLISAGIQLSALPGSPFPATRTCSGRKGLRAWFLRAQHMAPASSTSSNGLPLGSCSRESGVLPLRKRFS